jgi:putative phosphoesterase
MRIGIVSDTHSRLATVEKALAELERRRVEMVLHCGDIEDANTVKLFSTFPTHFVLGNCDTDSEELRRAISEAGGELHKHFGSIDLGRFHIAWIHGDNHRLMQDLEKAAHYDFLFYGHTHYAEQHRTGPTLMVNPGALHRAKPKSFAVLDVESGELEKVTLD